MRNPLYIVLLLTLITIINYFDRSAISYAILPIEDELGLNNAQFGIVAGAFGVGYLIMTLFAGFFLDRFGSIVIWGTTAMIWSLITMSMGLATGFWSLLSLRVLLGLAEGFNSPAIVRTVHDFLDPKWRARSISMALLGVPVASIIAGPFISHLIEREGWRSMFAILGYLGILWAIVWFLFFYKKKPIAKIKEPIARLPIFFTSAPYLANCFNFFSFGCTIFFGLMWLPGFLQQTHGISLKETGYLIMFPWMASAVLQTIGGWLSDYLWKKTQSIRISRVLPLCLGLFCSGICFFALLSANTLTTDMVLISLGLGFTYFVNPCIYSINLDLFPRHPATAQSISTCFFAISGIISPALTGIFSNQTGSFQKALLFIAIMPILASCSAFLFQKKISPVEH